MAADQSKPPTRKERRARERQQLQENGKPWRKDSPKDGKRPLKRPTDGSKTDKAGAKEGDKRKFRPGLFLAVFAITAATVYFLFGGSGYQSITTSEGIALLRDAEIERATITEGVQEVRLDLVEKTQTMDAEGKKHDVGDKVSFRYVEPQGEAIADLVEASEPKTGFNSVVPQENMFMSMIMLMLPFILLVGLFMFLLPRIQSGMGGFGRIKSRQAGVDKEMPDVTFADVAGADEAVEELGEIKEFLETPDKFHVMGAKIPKGVLLYGPPGTGKTLLAKAVAGEAGVPFFSISGSEFVEMFVGVGASRVRDLFEKAKQSAPAIIFVDEIDAVGRSRGVGIGGGNDEREQTLNQLLVEMDGFDGNTNVILIAATNRPDVLDQALLRPGRFDRQIAIDAPDLNGREKILRVHADGKPFAEGISLTSIARRTPGFTGADLANLLNEAALLAAREGTPAISEAQLDEAIDRVIAGPQRRTRVMSPDEKRMTAYHEGGHALAAAALRHTDPVTKVTILPRGRALGYTMVMPTEDRYSTSRNQLLDQMVYALGGRVAEEVVFHDPTTGASNDIQKATSLARKMVTEYGMSAKVGAVRLASEEADPMTRMPVTGGGHDYSDHMAEVIDAEVRALIDAAHDECWELITANRPILDELAARLLDKETLLEEELAALFSDVVKSPERSLWLSSDERLPQDLPPVPLPPVEQARAEELAEQAQEGAPDDPHV